MSRCALAMGMRDSAALAGPGPLRARLHIAADALDLLDALMAFEDPDSLLDQQSDPRLREERAEVVQRARELLGLPKVEVLEVIVPQPLAGKG